MSEKFTDVEFMICQSARAVEDSSTVFVGYGMAQIAMILAQLLYALDIIQVYEDGAIGPEVADDIETITGVLEVEAGVSLKDIVETLLPRYTIASCAADSEYGFPHDLAVMEVEELRKTAIDKGIRSTGHPDADLAGGTIVAILDGGSRKPKIVSLGEAVGDDAPISSII